MILDIADRVSRLAADDAWIIDFTNPVGIVTAPCSIMIIGRSGSAMLRSAINGRLRPYWAWSPPRWRWTTLGSIT